MRTLKMLISNLPVTDTAFSGVFDSFSSDTIHDISLPLLPYGKSSFVQAHSGTTNKQAVSINTFQCQNKEDLRLASLQFVKLCLIIQTERGLRFELLHKTCGVQCNHTSDFRV